MGGAKTGKSLLFNHLIGLEQNHFEEDSSRLPKQSSVNTWIWSIPLFFPNDDKFIFFIDTQGLEKNDHQNEAGQKIFTIITLISSCLFYNILGELNENTLRKLYLMATLPASITINSQSPSEDINDEKMSHFFPKLTLLLRDIEKDPSKELKLKEKNIKLSIKESMENVLNDFSKTRNDLTYKIKKSIISLFKNRDCIALPKPFKPSPYQNQEQISQEFLNCLISLREKIEKEIPAKSFYNYDLNPRMIISLLQFFVDISNQNGMLDISLG